MDIVLVVLAGYFGIGLLALGILDILTNRVRTKLQSASLETQSKLAITGNFVGNKSSMLLVLGALWLFWPVAIYGALTPSKEDKLDE